MGIAAVGHDSPAAGRRSAGRGPAGRTAARRRRRRLRARPEPEVIRAICSSGARSVFCCSPRPCTRPRTPEVIWTLGAKHKPWRMVHVWAAWAAMTRSPQCQRDDRPCLIHPHLVSLVAQRQPMFAAWTADQRTTAAAVALVGALRGAPAGELVQGRVPLPTDTRVSLQLQ